MGDPHGHPVSSVDAAVRSPGGRDTRVDGSRREEPRAARPLGKRTPDAYSQRSRLPTYVSWEFPSG